MFRGVQPKSGVETNLHPSSSLDLRALVKSMVNHEYLGGDFKYIVFFCLTLIYLGQWSNWMFPMGWNHQLDIIWQHDVSERSWNIFEKANLLAFSVEISHFKIPSTQECMNVDLDAAEKTNKFDKFGSLWIYKTPQELEIYQPPKFDNSPLKNDALKTILLSFLGLSRPIARGKKKWSRSVVSYPTFPLPLFDQKKPPEKKILGLPKGVPNWVPKRWPVSFGESNLAPEKQTW